MATVTEPVSQPTAQLAQLKELVSKYRTFRPPPAGFDPRTADARCTASHAGPTQ
jgi:hypothetical protein